MSGSREAVLARLRCGASVSGEVLAGELGVSRVAVGKHVSALRAMGYAIVAVPGSGYRLVDAPDAPLPLEVGPLIADGFWTRLEGGQETGSTNDDARALARAGAGQGTVVLASRQTAGRGRLGRTWVSPRGGAYLSAVLRPKVGPSEVGALALVVALGSATGIERLGASPRLKWPNDLLLERGKLAGVLLEMAAESDRVDWVVAGIGLNVQRPEDAPPEAAYLSDVVPGVRIPQAAAAVLDGIAQAYKEWADDGFESLRQEYERRSALDGREVTVSGLDGRVLAAGVASGVDASGCLRVREADGAERFVAAGDVTLRRPVSG